MGIIQNKKFTKKSSFTMIGTEPRFRPVPSNVNFYNRWIKSPDHFCQIGRMLLSEKRICGGQKLGLFHLKKKKLNPLTPLSSLTAALLHAHDRRAAAAATVS
jgi:hypothetical protein